MHLNQIHSFLTVSRTLNFTGAARQLGVPQSTISRQINDLESQLGVRLFYRTKRDVQLTDEGRTFLPFAQEIADAARKGSYAVKQLHEGSAGRLSIAVSMASQAYLASCLALFHERYPEVTVDITPIDGGESLLDETDAPYDFWFLYRDMLLDPDNFDYIHTHREPLHLACRAGSLPEEPAAQNYILLSEEIDPILYMQTMNYCRTHRFTPKVSNTFEDIPSILVAVSAGLGITILPASVLRSSSLQGIESDPLPDGSYDLDCIAAWKPSLLNPAATLFLNILKEKTAAD